jgi:4-hydroxythreonine-4-phosphate dehydrogenase
VANDIGGKYAFKSLQAAVTDVKQQLVDVLVTAPINKKHTTRGF